MAGLLGSLAIGGAGKALASGTKGRFVTAAGSAVIAFGLTTFYYKMQATCSVAASGYITWVNTTGDNTNRPACAGVIGDSVQIARWT